MFLFLFLIIDVYFLISEAIAQIFNLIEKLLWIPIKEVKVEIEIDPATVEAKIRKCSIWFKVSSFIYIF